MASISDDPNGRKRILLVAPDGSRKTIRLGKCDRKTAESICRHVEALLSSRIGEMPLERTTASWLASSGDTLKEKLVNVGLIDAPKRVPLGDFLTGYLNDRSAELKPSTMTVHRQAARWLLRSIDPATPVDRVTPTDADRVRAELLRGRARATANE